MNIKAHWNRGDVSRQDVIQRQKLYVAVFYTVLWPTFILVFVFTALVEQGDYDQVAFRTLICRVYLGFAVSYLIVQAVQRLLPIVFREDRFWPQFALHIFSILLVIQLGRIFMEPIGLVPENPARVIPLAMLVSQVMLFVAVKTFLFEREVHFSTVSLLQQTKINLLRSQSNPHFLFNTLNLLASEIPRSPANAREIVYDLADLLRESMSAAEQKYIRVEEEMRLVNLYFKLQQKRFPDRLEYTHCVPEPCAQLEIPALILQPIVENVVKHVVAAQKQLTTISVTVDRQEDQLVLRVSDSGLQKHPTIVNEGDGLRIVKETLDLHYQGKASLEYAFSDEGGIVTITLPAQYPTKARGIEVESFAV